MGCIKIKHKVEGQRGRYRPAPTVSLSSLSSFATSSSLGNIMGKSPCGASTRYLCQMPNQGALEYRNGVATQTTRTVAWLVQ